VAPKSVAPAEVLGRLGRDDLAVLASLERDGAPHLSTVSWYRGRPPDAVDLVIGRTARFLRNIERQPDCTLLVFLDSVYALAGTAAVTARDIPDLPIPLSLVRLTVTTVYASLFTGAELVAGPRHRKRYPPKLRNLDALVDAYLDRVTVPAGVSAPLPE
jgi:hypothetical protein